MLPTSQRPQTAAGIKPARSYQSSNNQSRREASQVALASLSTISAGQSEAIALAYFGGQTYAEAAATLNLSLPAAKARIRDGFRNLRHSMGPAGTD